MSTVANDEEAQQQVQPLLDTSSSSDAAATSIGGNAAASDAAATSIGGNAAASDAAATSIRGNAAASDASSPVQWAISQTFQSTAHLANHLPTGTVLAFQILAPLFTNQGHCFCANRTMTAVLVVLCGLTCFIICFSDSFIDPVTGKVRYGFATIKGLWVVDGGSPPEDPKTYKLRAVDFVHGVVSVLIFASVALLDQNVVSCFYPVPSESTKQVLSAMPIGIGVLGSMLCVTFPTSRHGIGFPLSPST